MTSSQYFLNEVLKAIMTKLKEGRKSFLYGKFHSCMIISLMNAYVVHLNIFITYHFDLEISVIIYIHVKCF